MDPLFRPEWLAEGPVWGMFCVFGEIWSLLKPVLPALVCMGPISPLLRRPLRGLLLLDSEPVPRMLPLLDWLLFICVLLPAGRLLPDFELLPDCELRLEPRPRSDFVMPRISVPELSFDPE